LVVPVLPAAGSLKPSRRAVEPVPPSITSAIIVVTRNAVASLIARCADGMRSYRIVPSASSTRRTSAGVRSRPPSANAPKAAVIDCNVTSPDPSASDGTRGTDSMPIRCANCTAAGIPTVSSMRTAARLLDVLSAARMVMDDPSWCPSSGTHSPSSVMTGSSRLVSIVAGE
jgi:hypothetical protein